MLKVLSTAIFFASSCAMGMSTTPPERLNVSLPNAQENCTSTSDLIGQNFDLTTRSHGVTGKIEVVDDCTLRITNFNYDGKGVQVELYSAVDGDFTAGQPLSRDILRTAKPYQNSALLVKLPEGLTVDTIEGLSIWCSDVAVSFGDVLFSKAEVVTDISLSTAIEAQCTANSPLIGKSFALKTIAHDVSGTVEVIDDCTLRFHNFNYDGKGLQVEIFSAKNGDFNLGRALSVDLFRPTLPYVAEELVLKLPIGESVDTIEGVSVWCTEVGANFGDVLFEI